MLLFLPGFLLFYSCKSSINNVSDNQEWQTLFNGKDLEGWIPKFHHHETGENYANTFRVENGVIQVNYDAYDSFDERYGHLF
ncbi:MAG: family 16 glycoside hydrolase [Cyclobacteriaceae bacterium]